MRVVDVGRTRILSLVSLRLRQLKHRLLWQWGGGSMTFKIHFVSEYQRQRMLNHG